MPLSLICYKPHKFSRVKPLHWYNDGVLEEVRTWPAPAQKDLGHQMRDVQNGEFPERAKWLTTVGSGVIQLKTNGYRTIVCVAIEDEVWAVHAFKKDSAESSETRKRHIDLAKQRVNELMSKLNRRH